VELAVVIVIIIVAWVLTIPAAGLAAAGCYELVHLFI
jgi:phosphate/sulfate permease